jgi:hypothetical protein
MGGIYKDASVKIGKSDVRSVVVLGSVAGFTQEIIAGPHRMAADEPMTVDGSELGAVAFLLAALGAVAKGCFSPSAMQKELKRTGGAHR